MRTTNTLTANVHTFEATLKKKKKNTRRQQQWMKQDLQLVRTLLYYTQTNPSFKYVLILGFFLI